MPNGLYTDILLLSGPPEAPSNCTIDYRTYAVRFVCEPSFDGGSQQAFSLQTLVTTRYKTVANRTSPDFILGHISSFGNTTVRMCSVNVEFSDQFSCSPPFEAAVIYGRRYMLIQYKLVFKLGKVFPYSPTDFNVNLNTTLKLNRLP